MTAVVPLPLTVWIIFSFLFHSISQSQWDITIITAEICSARVNCSDAYLYAKWSISWNVSLMGEKQLVLLHALVVQLRDLSSASVYTAFLIYTHFCLIHFSHDWYTMEVLGTLWLALPCSLYIGGLTDHVYAAKISYIQGQSHKEQYPDYLESKPIRLGLWHSWLLRITIPSSILLSKAEEGLFTRTCRDRTRSNDFKLNEGRFRLDGMKKFFTVGVVRHWNRLPREVVTAPSLEVFQARLDGTLSNPI